MDKNTLELIARHRTLCFYTNLRVLSSYLSVSIQEYLLQKRESVCLLNKFCRISGRTLLFINYSDRANYKGKLKFSVSTQESVDLRFSRKFCREVTVDVRSEVRHWIKHNSHVAKSMWTLYNNPATKHLIFENYNIYKIRKLLMGYNYIQALLVIESLAKLKTRIVQQNIPSEIDKLQRIFFESFPVNILAVYDMSQSSIVSSLGVDGKFFKAIGREKNKLRQKRFRGIAFRKFSKIYAVKRDFFLKDLTTDEICKRFKFELKKKMLRFCFKLLQCCNFKTLRKNYKGGNARRILISSKTLKEFRVLELHTLKDRVLQQILSWGIRPISESQADSLSFGFRPQRSAVQAIAYVYNKLFKNKAP